MRGAEWASGPCGAACCGTPGMGQPWMHGGPWSRSWLHLRLRASGPFVLRPKHFRRCWLPWNPKLEWEGPSPRATVRWEMQEFWRCEMDMYVGAGVCVTTVD